MLLFCPKRLPTSAGVPMENPWISQTPPHPLSPPRFLEGTGQYGIWFLGIYYVEEGNMKSIEITVIHYRI